MKIKQDFVTNSSSNCYIFVIPTSNFSEYDIRKYDRRGHILQELDVLDTMEKIIGWVQNEPVDWVNPIMGPRKFDRLDRIGYDRVLKSYQELKQYGDALVLVNLVYERSMEGSNEFEHNLIELINKKGGYVVTTESW